MTLPAAPEAATAGEGVAYVAYVGLGANLGDPPAMLVQALADLADLPQTRLLAWSPLYRSAPVGAVGPDFYNAVAEISTHLAPVALLDALQGIERKHGRERPFLNAPRTLDLDLLLYGDLQLSSARLTLPHPRLHERAFALLPLQDLNASLQIPGVGSLANSVKQIAGQRIERCGNLAFSLTTTKPSRNGRSPG